MFILNKKGHYDTLTCHVVELESQNGENAKNDF